MNRLSKYVEQGKVYRRSDLEHFSTSIDRELSELIKSGCLVKLSQGLYYAPKLTKFGIVPPEEHILIECFLKDDNFLIISPNLYNTLGLGLTQLYNSTWVYNHKRKGIIELYGKNFEFRLKSSFPKVISKEYLLIDLLNNLNLIAEDQLALIAKLPLKLNTFNTNKLREMSKLYGSGYTKRLLKSLLPKLI